MKLNSKSFLALAALPAVQAFWRMECPSRSGLARIDPIVNPGTVADHSHAIHGGNNFGFSTTYEDLIESNCTTCRVTQDNSAYWTPSLHFMYPNGTTVLVPQVGGMLAYYLLYGDNITAFPKNFRLLAGDTRQRNFSDLPVPDPDKSEWTAKDKTQFALERKAIGFNCLNYNADAEATLYRHFMPSKDYLDENCLDGLRLEMMFPSCWNGSLDSSDHKSHMAYPDLVMTGDCPDGYSMRTPSLLFETIWNTYYFKGVEGQFLLSNGDPTGYGYHGDFMAGWDVDLLQSAIDTCTNLSGEITDCPLFDIQTATEAATCSIDVPASLADDDCAGPRDGLPGNVPIQSGPGYATKVTAAATGVVTPNLSAQSVVPTLSYSKGTNVVTDNYGGGITVAAVADEAAATTSATTATTTADADVVAAAAVDASTVTSVAVLSDALAANEQIIGTSTFTSGGAVYVVAEVEDVVTVTQTQTVSPQKRHIHKHRRAAHGEHHFY